MRQASFAVINQAFGTTYIYEVVIVVLDFPVILFVVIEGLEDLDIKYRYGRLHGNW